MNEPPRRVALYGGSFDPVHPAHVAIARAAVSQAALDLVIFLPAAQSPLKHQGPEAPRHLRLAMLHAALGEVDWAEVSDWELARPGPSYSWQTVEHFQALALAPTEWFWLMGVDQWTQLERWNRWEHLAGLVTFLVFARDAVVPDRREGVKAIFLTGEFPGSATEVRAARRAEEAWERLVAPGVAAIIQRAGLYKSGHTDSAPPAEGAVKG